MNTVQKIKRIKLIADSYGFRIPTILLTKEQAVKLVNENNLKIDKIKLEVKENGTNTVTRNRRKKKRLR